MQKEEEKPASVNVALQYTIAQAVVARAGIRSAASVFCLGFGVKLSALRIDVSASLHPTLGLTPGLLLLYTAGK